MDSVSPGALAPGRPAAGSKTARLARVLGTVTLAALVGLGVVVRARIRLPPLHYCRPPGYSALIAAVPHTSTDEAALARPARYAQGLLGLLTCGLVLLLGRRLGGPLLGWPAALAVLFHPYLILYTSLVLSETLATFVTVLAAGAMVLAPPAASAASACSCASTACSSPPPSPSRRSCAPRSRSAPGCARAARRSSSSAW
jgi:hypothetical protein